MNTELEKIAYVYGDVCVRRRKQRRKRQRLIVIELLFDYAKNSTLHGLRYIAERGLTLVEKLFWFVTFMASIALCAFFIYNVYVKWKSSPVIVSVNEKLVSVGTVPFPSVTICPAIKCKRTVFNFTKEIGDLKKYKNNNLSISLTQEYVAGLENIQTLCDNDARVNIPTELRQQDYNFSKSLVADITKVSLKTRDIFHSCHWYYKTEKCSKLFSRVYTEEGVCYTANSLAARDIFTDEIQKGYAYMDSSHSINGWSSVTGEYTNYSVKAPYPKRGQVYGAEPDLKIILKIDPDHRDPKCNILYSGFKIFLHHPADFPTSSQYYYAALPDQKSSMAISFHQVKTDLSLVNSTFFDYSTEVRQCYFQFERPLRYFKIYSASNCQAECLSNYTYAKCKCVEYYMPHNDSDEICSPAMRECVADARVHMSHVERSAELGYETKEACMCRPACNNIEYDAEILKTDYKLKARITKKNTTKLFIHPLLLRRFKFNFEEDNNDSYSQVDLFFKKPQFMTMQRRELFGITDVLANIGGLLGLFLGFSFLSFVEIVYFLTLRVGFTLKRDLDEEKQRKIAAKKSQLPV